MEPEPKILELKLFPWDNNELPYWVNPENGIEWYVDKTTTEWCTRDTLNSLKKLNAVVFYVTKRINNKVEPIERVLIDKETNEFLYSGTSLEGICVKIDQMRLTRSL